MSAKHNDLVREIRLYLSSLNILSIDTPTPGLLFTKDGRPVKSTGKGKLDIHACAPMTVYDKDNAPKRIGVFVAIDAKIGKDKLHTEQLAYQRAVHNHHGIAFQAYNLTDVYDNLLKAGLIDETIPRPNR